MTDGSLFLHEHRGERPQATIAYHGYFARNHTDNHLFTISNYRLATD